MSFGLITFVCVFYLSGDQERGGGLKADQKSHSYRASCKQRRMAAAAQNPPPTGRAAEMAAVVEMARVGGRRKMRKIEEDEEDDDEEKEDEGEKEEVDNGEGFAFIWGTVAAMAAANV